MEKYIKIDLHLFVSDSGTIISCYFGLTQPSTPVDPLHHHNPSRRQKLSDVEIGSDVKVLKVEEKGTISNIIERLFKIVLKILAISI